MSAAPRASLRRVGGEGPDLLLVHGFGSDRYSWAAIAPAVTAAHRAWTVDLPGHGDAEAEVGDGSAAALAEAVDASLDAVKTPVVAVGHSLGAAVILALATMRPGLIARAIFIAPAGLGPKPDPGFLSDFPELDEPEAAAALLRRLVARPRLVGPQMVEHVLATLRRPGRREALRTVAASLAALQPVTPPAGLPFSILWGSEDGIIAPPAGEIAGRPVQTVAGAGHMPQIEAVGPVGRLLARALDGSGELE